MARYLLNTQDVSRVQRIRHLIRQRWGWSGELVFGEAAANVREHTAHHYAEVCFHAKGFCISSPEKANSLRTEKKAGEGGYGLQLIQELGGTVKQDPGLSVEWWTQS
jgi:hypothetical protein